jgi:hypothetical protein
LEKSTGRNGGDERDSGGVRGWTDGTLKESGGGRTGLCEESEEDGRDSVRSQEEEQRGTDGTLEEESNGGQTGLGEESGGRTERNGWTDGRECIFDS